MSNVTDFDETSGRLGCGEPTVFITARCSGAVTCVVDGITSLSWDRRLDDISEAEVFIGLGGDSKATCCQCLPEVEPWCHELHIWRDGEEVWVGPITEITFSYRRIIIRAKDSLAWLGIRVLIADLDFPTPIDIVDVAEVVVQLAFSEDAIVGTTCEVDNMYVVQSGLEYELFFEGFTQTTLETLRSLGDIGVDYTTLGRTIVLVGSFDPLIPLIMLNDSHIIGDIEITKDGTLQGNRYYVHFDGDGGIPASGETDDPFCYGYIEKLRDGDGLVNGVDAAAVADIYVNATAIAPRIVEIPTGSWLSPHTPWRINEMVPGTRVDVAITKTCFNLTQSFRLRGVKVEYTNGTDGTEQVSVDLSPIDSIATE